MSYWFIYLFTRLDAINSLGEVTTTILSLLTIFCLIAMGFTKYFGEIEDDEDAQKAFVQLKPLFIKVLLPLLLISSMILMFVPSTKEAAVIYLLPKVVNNEEVQKIPDNFLKILNGKMKSYFELGEKED